MTRRDSHFESSRPLSHLRDTVVLKMGGNCECGAERAASSRAVSVVISVSFPVRIRRDTITSTGATSISISDVAIAAATTITITSIWRLVLSIVLLVSPILGVGIVVVSSVVSVVVVSVSVLHLLRFLLRLNEVPRQRALHNEDQRTDRADDDGIVAGYS